MGSKKCYDKLSDEFRYVKAQAVEPLSTILDFVAREKMIDNVVMIIQGALNGKAPSEMQEKIHPLGVFDGMRVIMSESFDVQGGFDDLYRIFLVDTPIGKYFEEYLKECDRDKDEMARAGVETNQVGGILGKQDLEIMKAMLKMEADFRVLLVTLNALNTNLSTEAKLQDRN